MFIFWNKLKYWSLVSNDFGTTDCLYQNITSGTFSTVGQSMIIIIDGVFCILRFIFLIGLCEYNTNLTDNWLKLLIYS